MTRRDVSLPQNAKEEFDNNIHLFAINDNIHKHNRKKLNSLKKLVANSIASKEGSTNLGGGENDERDVEILLAKDARVMLTSNLWIEEGLEWNFQIHLKYHIQTWKCPTRSTNICCG